MILSDLIIPSRVNQCWEYSGLDSPEHCLDKTHFKQYPWPITYNYNSRGFRDQEWPNSIDQLSNAVWCVGDSFTVGLGSPVEHTWPMLLQKQTGRRVINVSMDGASNNWIARRTALIQKEINPTAVVVMWSYLHRRENDNHNISDEQRRVQAIASNDIDDAINFAHCVGMIKNSSVTQLAIPEYAPPLSDYQEIWDTVKGTDWPNRAPETTDEMLQLPSFIQTELKEYFKVWAELHNSIALHTLMFPIKSNLIEVERLDLARDGLHFDLITSQWIVDQITNNLTL